MAGLALAHFRTGQQVPGARIDLQVWQRDSDSWENVRKLTEILSEWQHGHHGEALVAWRAARTARYMPRSEPERRLYSECEQTLGHE